MELRALQTLPKIDLHRHLEGSVRLQTLIDIALEYSIEMPEYAIDTIRPFVQITDGQAHTPLNFLSKFQTLRQFYRSPQVIKRVAREAVEDAAADNVKYLELRFTPQALSNIIGASYTDVVGWVCEAAMEASERLGITTRLIVSMNRHEGRVVGAQVLNAALAHIQHGVVGIDLAGQEEGYSCEPFAAIFRLAKDLGLYTTVHAGEWVGAESVRAALDILHADRIGHGVRALDDPELLARLVEQQIPLEVCPTTNVHSGVVETFSVHPLPHLLSAGVMVTVNTDDPLISNVTLTDELRYSVSTFGLSWAQIQQLMLNAARAAFLPPSEREALVAKFQGWFAHD